MKRTWTVLWLSKFLVVSLTGLSFSQQVPNEGILKELLKFERRIWVALETRHLDTVLPILDTAYTGFESEVAKRFNSPQEHQRYRLEALKDVSIDTWEILNPRVQVYGNAAILTYFGHDSGKTKEGPYDHLWKVTAVYFKGKGGWKIVHYHWSLDSDQ